MTVCPACGAENREGARFCDSCGAALEDAAAAREQRKTVTIVFCDVTGSTALGERLDPESLRRVMARYFEAMRTVVERHGGTVEKFIGDAVMAVFGVPVVHEDDALRAVRAAAEMRDALRTVNEELERDYGTTLAARIGVNTGEVVIGTEERLATGDAVNVAARLEQAAEPGEILVGAETCGLVRDAVETEEVAPITAKGKEEPLRAVRLLTVRPDAPAFERRLDAPMVGRERQQRLLADAFANCVSESSCGLFTILGPAGVGKSRLVGEFLRSVDATVVRGRCLSYGEGISYWPVVETVKQLLGDDPETRLRELVPDELAAHAIAGLLGEQETSPDAIARAVRKLFEAAAADEPLIVVFDDVHWGEPTFLDLVEHIADLSRGAAILVLCLARPELLDRRPGWGGGKLNATTILLEPLSADETDELIAELLGVDDLDGNLRARIRQAAEGNPLFVEEMVAMLRERPGEEVAVPPTIQALLAARLDQLDPSERGVLERGAVEGQIFHRGAVVALAPDEPHVDGRLTALVRKELVRPERTQVPGDDAYRFRHLLIRDSAYDALPKATRAELHERFAEWLDEHGGDLVEQDEIVGYHLEQAYRYRAELGPVDDAGRALARRAAERLVAGGQHALARRDVRAVVALMGRALELLPEDDDLRFEALFHRATAQIDAGEIDGAIASADAALAFAEGRGDPHLTARAELRRTEVSTHVVTARTLEEDIARVRETMPLFERLGDRNALAEAWSLLGRLLFFSGRAAESLPAYERAIGYAEEVGNRHIVQQAYAWRSGAMRYGPTRLSDWLAAHESIPAEILQDPLIAGDLLMFKGSVLAMLGRFEEARDLQRRGLAIAAEFGLDLWQGAWTMEVGETELYAGEPETAERALRGGWERLGAIGETGFRSTVGAYLADSVMRQGRDQEAEELATEAIALAHADDFQPRAYARGILALVHARRGELEEAERLARDAVALIATTDYLESVAEAQRVLGIVLAAAGRREEAAAALERALEVSEQKGNVVMAAQLRRELGALEY
jgi:class 3 adenylate cyclase/tetratricopeptide (TPR) repeat protein